MVVNIIHVQCEVCGSEIVRSEPPVLVRYVNSRSHFLPDTGRGIVVSDGRCTEFGTAMNFC